MALASARSLPRPPILRSLAASRLNVRLAVGLACLALAVLGLVAVYRAAQPRTVEVLRTTRDVQPGRVIGTDDLQVVAAALPDEIAASLVPASERGALVGRRVAQPLNAGDLVTRRQAAPANAALGPGERLYALPVPSEVAAGLHLQPADQVEIVVTTNKARPDIADTRVVLPRVTIFALGGAETTSGFAVGGANADRPGLGTNRLTTLVLRTDEAGYQALAKARLIGDLDLSLVAAPEVGEP